jgi:hypothetical protein
MAEAEPGDIGIMQYSTDHYIFNKLTNVGVGERGLLVPLSGNEYRVLKLALVGLGEKVTIVHDRKGNYYAVE